ncbi:MAG: helix-turn-helix domain-containing protein [Thermogutta sp.]
MKKRYLVTLTLEEKAELQGAMSKGTAAARKLVRVRILLLADEAEGGPAKTDVEIVAALGCGWATVERVRRLFVEEGLEAALVPKPTTWIHPKCRDGQAEAHLVAMVCGAPPEARDRWTLRLLADRMVALGYVETVSHETIRRRHTSS